MGVPEHVAPLPHLAVFSQEPIHGTQRAEVGPLAQQLGVDLRRRLADEAFLMQDLQDARPLRLRQCPRLLSGIPREPGDFSPDLDYQLGPFQLGGELPDFALQLRDTGTRGVLPGTAPLFGTQPGRLARSALPAPVRQLRGVQALTAQQCADLAGTTGVRLLKDLQL